MYCVELSLNKIKENKSNQKSPWNNLLTTNTQTAVDNINTNI
jgi:hypothetical protein